MSNRLIINWMIFWIILIKSIKVFDLIFPNMVDEKNAVNSKGIPEILKTSPQGTPNHARIIMNLAMILESKLIFILVHGENNLKSFDLARTNRDLTN